MRKLQTKKCNQKEKQQANLYVVSVGSKKGAPKVDISPQIAPNIVQFYVIHIMWTLLWTSMDMKLTNLCCLDDEIF